MIGEIIGHYRVLEKLPSTEFIPSSSSGQAVVAGIPPLRDKLSRRIGTSRPAHLYIRRFQSDWPNHIALRNS